MGMFGNPTRATETSGGGPTPTTVNGITLKTAGTGTPITPGVVPRFIMADGFGTMTVTAGSGYRARNGVLRG